MTQSFESGRSGAGALISRVVGEGLVSRIVDRVKSENKWAMAEHALVAYVLWKTTSFLYGKIRDDGIYKTVGDLFIKTVTSVVPGSKGAISSTIEKEAEQAVRDMFGSRDDHSKISQFAEIPQRGYAHTELLAMMRVLKREQRDINPAEGKAWAYVYDAGDEHTSLVTSAHDLFIHTNALNPMAFSSLRRMENDVVRMALSLFHGGGGGSGGEKCCGTMSSGGTESLLLAVKTYRDRARALRPHITRPEIILCKTAHPALFKACHLFDVLPVTVDCDPVTMRLDVRQMARKISRNTILLVASAPQYPHGVIDPVEDVAALALKHDLPLHIDACIGGWLLPWFEQLGRKPSSLWDFRVKGVTSISADLHKFAYAAKGASVILYRSHEIRKYQFYNMAGWPGGLYVSSTLLGTRGGGPIAAAWASLLAMGRQGFLDKARDIADTVDFILGAIAKNPLLEVVGQPDMSIIAIRSTDPARCNVHAVADVMKDKGGWVMDREQNPDCLHMTVMPQHVNSREQFIRDLNDAVDAVLRDPALNKTGSAAMYGMLAKIPSDVMIEEFLTAFLDKIYD